MSARGYRCIIGGGDGRNRSVLRSRAFRSRFFGFCGSDAGGEKGRIKCGPGCELNKFLYLAPFL